MIIPQGQRIWRGTVLTGSTEGFFLAPTKKAAMKFVHMGQENFDANWHEQALVPGENRVYEFPYESIEPFVLYVRDVWKRGEWRKWADYE